MSGGQAGMGAPSGPPQMMQPQAQPQPMMRPQMAMGAAPQALQGVAGMGQQMMGGVNQLPAAGALGSANMLGSNGANALGSLGQQPNQQPGQQFQFGHNPNTPTQLPQGLPPGVGQPVSDNFNQQGQPQNMIQQLQAQQAMRQRLSRGGGGYR